MKCPRGLLCVGKAKGDAKVSEHNRSEDEKSQVAGHLAQLAAMSALSNSKASTRFKRECDSDRFVLQREVAERGWNLKALKKNLIFIFFCYIYLNSGYQHCPIIGTAHFS